MTLDEAIKHAEEVAERNEWFDKNCLESIQCKECAKEHIQLAEWLKDYKRLKEQESIFDKVRAEIKEVYNDRPDSYNHSQRTELFCNVMKIIDKYKAESEDICQ